MHFLVAKLWLGYGLILQCLMFELGNTLYVSGILDTIFSNIITSGAYLGSCCLEITMSFISLSQVSLDHLSLAMQEEYIWNVSSKNVQHGGSSSSSQNCSDPKANDGSLPEPVGRVPNLASAEELTTSASTGSMAHDPSDSESKDDGAVASSSGSSWFQLRSDATTFVSQTLQRGRRNLWQLTTSRLSVLLSSDAAGSTSIHQFLKNYEDLNTFILAGEAFCGAEAVEFRRKVKAICESYYASFHRKNICVS